MQGPFHAQERFSTAMMDWGILTASCPCALASRAFQRRLCMDWQKVSLWN